MHLDDLAADQPPGLGEEGPHDLDAAVARHAVGANVERDPAAQAGVNIREMLWTMGDCDMMCVLEAEYETSLAAFDLATAMQGNVRSRSLRAYTSGEMDKILTKLP